MKHNKSGNEDLGRELEYPCQSTVDASPNDLGPWDIIEGKGSLLHIETAYNAPKAGIAICSVNKKKIGNGRLIAAAPELLVLLKTARQCIAYCRKAHKDIQTDDGVPIELFIDGLIAKVAGRKLQSANDRQEQPTNQPREERQHKSKSKKGDKK